MNLDKEINYFLKKLVKNNHKFLAKIFKIIYNRYKCSLNIKNNIFESIDCDRIRSAISLKLLKINDIPQLYKNKKVKARIQHTCSNCKNKISPKEYYINISYFMNTYYKNLCTIKICKNCEKIGLNKTNYNKLFCKHKYHFIKNK